MILLFAVNVVFISMQFFFARHVQSIKGVSVSVGFSLLYTLMAAIALVCVFFEVGLIVRRLHDFNKSGLYFLAILIPYVNIVFVIYLMFKKGSPAENRFGQPVAPRNIFKALFAKN